MGQSLTFLAKVKGAFFDLIFFLGLGLRFVQTFIVSCKNQVLPVG